MKIPYWTSHIFCKNLLQMRWNFYLIWKKNLFTDHENELVQAAKRAQSFMRLGNRDYIAAESHKAISNDRPSLINWKLLDGESETLVSLSPLPPKCSYSISISPSVDAADRSFISESNAATFTTRLLLLSTLLLIPRIPFPSLWLFHSSSILA